MHKVTYGAACSLDGYIARADGGLERLRWSRSSPTADNLVMRDGTGQNE
jgi:hypothetical protein